MSRQYAVTELDPIFITHGYNWKSSTENYLYRTNGFIKTYRWETLSVGTDEWKEWDPFSELPYDAFKVRCWGISA